MNAEHAVKTTGPTYRQALIVVLCATLLWMVGCAEMPTGPTVAVMPAPNKPFEVFMQEEQLCRDWAAHSIGQPGHDAAAQRLLSSTAAGLAIGTLVGAAAGGHRNVEAGAAMGTVMGAATGTSQSSQTAWSAQRRYDIAYQQCMYSKGNMVPSYGYNTNRYTAPPPPPPLK